MIFAQIGNSYLTKPDIPPAFCAILGISSKGIKMTEEQWKPVVGFEGTYEVSDHGRVRSVDRVVVHRDGVPFRYKSKLRKQHTRGAGYLFVMLWKGGQQKFHHVHRMVAMAFLGECLERIQVNHKDGIRTNNHVSNLEWCTQSENLCHAVNMLGRIRGERNAKCKLTDVNVTAIRTSSLSAQALAKKYGVRAENIRLIRRGETWRHLL